MPRPRILVALGLAAALAVGGCQNPDGSTNWGNTLLLGAGVGAAAALAAGAVSDDRPNRGYGRSRYGNGPRYDRGPRYGYAEPRFAPTPYGYGRW